MNDTLLYDQDADPSFQSTGSDQYTPEQYQAALAQYQKSNPLQEVTDFWEWSWNAGYVLDGLDGKSQEQWAEYIYDQFGPIHAKIRQEVEARQNPIRYMIGRFVHGIVVGSLSFSFVAAVWAITIMLAARWYGSFVGVPAIGYWPSFGIALLVTGVLGSPSVSDLTAVNHHRVSNKQHIALNIGWWMVVTLSLFVAAHLTVI